MRKGYGRMKKELQQMLKENGFEVMNTMDRFMQNEELYFKFLKKLTEDGNFEGLKKALADKDYQKAFGHAHTLKGVLANLGIEDAYRKIIPLVEALRHEETDGLEDRMKEFSDSYEKASKIIETLS